MLRQVWPECIHIGVVWLLVNDGIHSFFPEYDLSGKSIVINHTKMYVGRFVLHHTGASEAKRSR